MDSAIASMSTSALALLSGLAYGIYKLILSYRKERWKGVTEHFAKDVVHGLIFGLFWWAILLAYHLFIKVPHRIEAEADSIVAPSAKQPVPPSDAYSHTPHLGFARSASTAFPRLDSGPAAYKNLTPEQVADWALAESDRLTDLVNKYQQMAISNPGMTFTMVQHFFQEEFKGCCWPALRDIRMEVVARLGPAGIDADENETWDRAFPDQDKFYFFNHLGMHEIEDYAPLLRRIAINLERTYVPRPAPENLLFSESTTDSGYKDFPSKTVALIKTNTERKHGYVVAFFSEGAAMTGCNVARSQSIYAGIQVTKNDDLSKIVGDYSIHKCVVWIGSIPFSSKAPMQVILIGKNPMHVARAQYIPE